MANFNGKGRAYGNANECKDHSKKTTSSPMSDNKPNIWSGPTGLKNAVRGRLAPAPVKGKLPPVQAAAALQAAANKRALLNRQREVMEREALEAEVLEAQALDQRIASINEKGFNFLGLPGVSQHLSDRP